MTRPFFETAFASSVDAMVPALEGALIALVKEGWIDGKDTFYAHLCLEEALVNAIVHGNGGDAARKVRLLLSEEDGCCVIRVCDEGHGFRVDDVKPPDRETHGGRGICLIRYCMDDVRYDPASHCLVMRMRRRFSCKE